MNGRNSHTSAEPGRFRVICESPLSAVTCAHDGIVVGVRTRLIIIVSGSFAYTHFIRRDRTSSRAVVVVCYTRAHVSLPSTRAAAVATRPRNRRTGRGQSSDRLSQNASGRYLFIFLSSSGRLPIFRVSQTR